MSESKNNENTQLELKIENMLDKLIETDEELENNDDSSSLKFSEDMSESEDNIKNEKFFEKEFFFNEDQNQNNKISNLPKNNIANINTSQKKNIEINQSLSQSNLNNYLYNNYAQFQYNPIFSQSVNKKISSSSVFGPSYSNINCNSTTSFSSAYDNNNNNNILNSNYNNSYIFRDNNINTNYNNYDNNSIMSHDYQGFNNSYIDENKNFIFDRSKKVHNSFFAGDKICFNNNDYNTNILFKNPNQFNANVELEILLIEVKKILNKIEKIDLLIYNKLKGKFEQIIKTHKGSRIFQNYLKNTHSDILHQIFLELKGKLSELLRDNYANYFCKKFFNSLNQKDRIEYLNTIQKDLSTLAIDITATYPIQGIIEQLGSKAEKKIVYIGVKDSISVFCYNIYGTHILEKILSYFEDEFIKEIIDYVYNNFIDLSYHINGICIVKKLLLMTHKKELHKKIKKIINDNAHNLIVHQYGNYVIQTIVDNWDDNELEDIINQYRNKYLYLSEQKYSSNAIERIIEKNNKNLEIYINEICNENNIIEAIKNKYGNYVIQKAVKLSSGAYRDKLITEISKNLNKLEDKKIINKWKTIISSKSSF